MFLGAPVLSAVSSIFSQRKVTRGTTQQPTIQGSSLEHISVEALILFLDLSLRPRSLARA